MWNPHLIKHIKQIESVQRRFTKRLPGMTNRTYRKRLAVTGLESLELRRLIYDLVCTYKILWNKLLPPDTLVPGSPGLMDVNVDDLFSFNLSSHTRSHAHKLYKARCAKGTRQNFFVCRVINVWNSLPNTVCFNSQASFKLKNVDFSEFLKCY